MRALSARGLEKRYGATTALAGVDVDVAEGELVGLLGPNGAGKSTLVKIACGLVRPTRGQAEVCGAKAGSLASRRKLGYLAELFRFPGWYSADELIALHQRLSGSTGGEDERSELLSSSASPRPATAAWRRCRRGCSSALGSPRRWSVPRPSCCSTSPRARSTRSAAAPCVCCWRSCAAAEPRCC